MSRIQRKTTAITTLQIVAAAVIILAVLVGLAFFLAQPKPEAPPKSKVSYQAAPTEKPKPKKSGGDDPFVPVSSPKKASAKQDDVQAASAESTETPQNDTPYRITGLVTNANDNLPLAEARVTAIRIASPGESAPPPSPSPRPGGGFRRGGDPNDIGYATTNDDGTYELTLIKPGTYRVEFTAKGFMNVQKIAEALTQEQPVQKVNAELASGATVSGRVKIAGSNEGAPELRVYVEHGADTTTDADGNYELTGLMPGEAGVTVELRGSEFVAGKALPFQKVKIATAQDHVRNVDFEVEAAGIVWGYVTSGDKLGVPNADVVLCTSDSPLNRRFSASMPEIGRAHV